MPDERPNQTREEDDDGRPHEGPAGAGVVGAVMARRVTVAMAVPLWGVIAVLNLGVLFSSGPDVLVLVSLLVVAVLGAGILGALTEGRGGPR